LITPHPLHSPKILNIKIFSKEAKQRITQKLFESLAVLSYEIKNTYDKNIEEKIASLKKIVEGYVKFMNDGEDLSYLIPDFFEYNNIIDKYRGQKLIDCIPEVYELMRI